MKIKLSKEELTDAIKAYVLSKLVGSDQNIVVILSAKVDPDEIEVRVSEKGDASLPPVK